MTVLFMVSCNTLRQPAETSAVPSSQKKKFAEEYTVKLGIPLSPSCNETFIKYITEWIGVPYSYGGKSKTGTDCSGFVMNVFTDVYAKSTNRSAQGIYEQVTVIDTASLQEGDLVFFKINTTKVGHVGIYITDSYFIHASTSKGVIISSLSEKYYTKYFFAAGRF